MISKLLNLLTKFGLPIIAIGLIAFAVKYMAEAKQRVPVVPPPIEPAANPFANCVAGAGMVEPETENISIGAPLPGIVVEVMVKVGQRVKAGTPLFRIDDREMRAELVVRQAMLADATASLERLEAMPRPEEIPAAEAKVREAKAEWENWEQQWARGEKLVTDRTMTQEEFQERKQTAIGARERYNKAVADYNLLKAGTWEPEKRVARSAVERAKSQVEQAQTEVDRLDRKSPGRRRSAASERAPGRIRRLASGPSPRGPRQHHAAARARRYRRIRHPAVHRQRPGPRRAQGPVEGFLPAQVRPNRAVRHSQKVAHGRQHRARRYPRAAGHLRSRRRQQQPIIRRPTGRCVHRRLRRNYPIGQKQHFALNFAGACDSRGLANN